MKLDRGDSVGRRPRLEVRARLQFFGGLGARGVDKDDVRNLIRVLTGEHLDLTTAERVADQNVGRGECGAVASSQRQALAQSGFENDRATRLAKCFLMEPEVYSKPARRNASR